MSSEAEKALSQEIESFYSRADVEELSQFLNAGTPGLLFPDLQAATLARRLLQKRPRRGLIAGEGRAARAAAVASLYWRECDEEEFGRFAAEFPGVARFFSRDGERFRIPPRTANLLLEAFDESGPGLPPPEAADAAAVSSRFDQVPDILADPTRAPDPELPPQIEASAPAVAAARKLIAGLKTDDPTEPIAAAEGLRNLLCGRTDPSLAAALLPHLKRRPSGGAGGALEAGSAADALFALTAELVPCNWFDLRQFVAAAGAAPGIRGLFDPDYAADYLYFERESSYRNYLGDSGIHSEQRYIDTSRLYREACLDPLVSGWLGLAWLCGMIDFLPGSEAPPFSPWLACSRFRINPWGAWILRGAGEPPRWRPRRAIRLSAAGEIALLGEPSPRAEALLRRIGTVAGDGAFRLGRDTLLASCGDAEELEQVLHELVEQAELPLPPFWEAYFGRLREGIVRLEEVPETHVFRLPAESRLPELIASDPAVAALLRRAEGRMIVVERRKLPRLKSLLAQHGVLLAGAEDSTEPSP